MVRILRFTVEMTYQVVNKNHVVQPTYHSALSILNLYSSCGSGDMLSGAPVRKFVLLVAQPYYCVTERHSLEGDSSSTNLNLAYILHNVLCKE